MNTIRISRVFRFDASHALQTSNGSCKPIHGHSYTLTVTLLGEPHQLADDHTKGMVINFSDLSSLVEAFVIKPWQHALLLHQHAPAGLIESWKKIDKKLVLLPYQPTCENLLLDIRDTLQEHLPQETILHSLKLAESENAFVEWHANDNNFVGYQNPDADQEANAFVQDCLLKANAADW